MVASADQPVTGLPRTREGRRGVEALHPPPAPAITPTTWQDPEATYVGPTRALVRLAPFLLAAVLSLLLLVVNASWMQTFPDTIDGWLYFGYFENPRTYLHAFSGTYYGTRLAWILPGAVFHQLLPDFLANFVLHTALYCAGLMAVAWAVRRAAGGRAALAAVVMLGTYSYYLFSTGWNYVDGAGIAYYAAALAAITGASGTRWRRVAIAAAGCAYAAAVHTNILWLALGPPFIVYVVRFCWPANGRSGVLDAMALMTGAAACTALLGAINLSLGSDFLFFRPSFTFAASTVRQLSPYHRPDWVLSARWLVFPLVALVTALVWRVQGIERPAVRTLVDHYLLSWLMFLALAAVGRPVLELPYSASYLIPAMALSIAAQLSGPLNRLTTRQFQWLALLSVIAGVVAYWPPVARVFSSMLWHWPLVVVATLLIAAFLVQQARKGALTALALAAAVSNVAVADAQVFDFSGGAVRTQSFRAILEASDVLDEINPDASARFWYLEDSRLGKVFEAVSSTRLWGYRLVGNRFPSLWNPIANTDAVMQAGQRIVILTDDTNALAKAALTLRPLKLHPSPVVDRVIEDGGIRFHLVLAELVPAAP